MYLYVGNEVTPNGITLVMILIESVATEALLEGYKGYRCVLTVLFGIRISYLSFYVG